MSNNTKYKLEKLFRNMLKSKDVGSSWVARMTGWEINDAGYLRLSREFVREDHLEWIGKKAEKWPRALVGWDLEDGRYEVCAYKTQKAAENLEVDDGDPNARRYFLEVKGGQAREISREELEKLLGPCPAPAPRRSSSSTKPAPKPSSPRDTDPSDFPDDNTASDDDMRS
jgi:hypothetical protein